MKILRLALPLVIATSLAACATVAPIPRDELAANLAPILKIERRSDQIKYYTGMLLFLGALNEEKLDELKAHYDIYYVYYLAANVYLARGSMGSYTANVKLAEQELDVMETIVKERLGKLDDLQPGAKNSFSRFGF